ncbi:MAG: site-specific integrase [Myxococcales bacterium]|nr:site-specific integrase [Myxococcales bacterium]
MSINITKRTYKSGKQAWLVDIRIHYPCGARHRAKVTKPVTWSKTQTERWARQHEQHLIKRGPPRREADEPERQDVSFREFAARYLAEYPQINNLRPSSVERYERHVAQYFNPAFGDMHIDAVGKAQLRELAALDLAPSSRNVLISELACMLRVAHDWGVRAASPPPVKRVKEDARDPQWYTPEEYRALIASAPTPVHLGLVLLGGDAGLRCGEIRALRISDIDFRGRGRLHVRRSMWRGIEGPTKGRRERVVPLTSRLRACLEQLTAGHAPDAFVLTGTQASMTKGMATHRMKVMRAVVLGVHYKECDGPIHILRHTFCSNLVLAGKHPRVIQKLAGHSSLQITERYMSVAGEQIEDAIAGLETLDPAAASDGSRAPKRGYEAE